MVKVGDRVQIDEVVSYYYGRCGIVTHDDACETYPYTVKFDDGDDCIFKGSDLIVLSTEEETSMKFKVGDKVKVSNSWEGRSGEVGEITRRNIWEAYPVRVTFEDGVYESFKEDELELVKEKAEKQSFTKSDLKTGMGVVLRDGSKGHVLIGTPTQDTIRFIGKNEWIGLDDYADDLTIERFKHLDIVAVYQTKFENQYMTDRVFEQDVLYERKEEPIKMTMKEINEHFGKAIEIIE